MAVNPTPQRQRVVTFPTPNVNDFLFYEVVDAQRLADEGTAIPEYGTKHPDRDKWPDHRLVHVSAGDNQNKFYQYYYASDRIDQDENNWSFDHADIGGTKFDAVTRDYIIRRSEFSETTPAMGDTMPDTPTGKFSGTYVLAIRDQKKTGDKILDGLYVIERRTYVKKTSSTSIGTDDLNGETLSRVTTLFYNTETVGATGQTAATLFGDPQNSYWGVQANAIKRSGRQLTSNWFQIDVDSIIGGAVESDSDGVKAVSSFNTSVNYTFPSVLSTVRIDGWEKRAGGVVNVTAPVMSKHRYSGPCKASILVTWSKTPQTVAPDSPPQPLPINISTPYFSINVPACLHSGYNLDFTNGTEDLVYKYTVANFSFGATNYTDWPASLVVSDTQKPYRGGYLREKTTVFAPT